MGFARMFRSALLLLAFPLCLHACVFGDEQCSYAAQECVGSTGAYRVCTGGEGYTSWDNHQCPGFQPVCSANQAGRTSCQELALPAQCSQVTELLAVGAAKLSRVTDLDGDGRADLVFEGDVVARSTAPGAFAAPSSLGLVTAGHLLQILPANLNGDLVPDLVVSSEDPRELYAFFGDGMGGYAFSARYFVDTVPTLDAAADLDGDGRDELIGASLDQGLHVISGLGQSDISDRLIDTTTSAYLGPSAMGAFVADFDGHPPLDLAAVTSSLDIYLAQPDNSYLRVASPSGTAVADLDGDGRADVIGSASSTGDQNGVSIHFAGLDASFKRSTTIAMPYAPAAELLGDFDGNGVPDLAVLLGASPNAVLGVLLGRGDGTFAAPSWSSLPFSAEVHLSANDIDGDGRSDLIAQVGSNVLVLRGGCSTP
jgi:FG-GAP-like repeat